MNLISRYAPLLVRSILYSLISGLAIWTTAIGDLGGEELWHVVHERWFALTLLSLMAIATTLRAQFDATISYIPKKGEKAPNDPPPKILTNEKETIS